MKCTQKVGRGVRYYLSLGDSLAVGVQPTPDGSRAPTDAGFADQLYASLRERIAGLTLVKLGCDGESTRTMLHGGACPYPRGAQLAEALAFLATNQGRVALITLSLGANDIVSCARDGEVDLVCVEAGFVATETNLPMILERLREAAGRETPIYALNLYNPFLAHWFHGEGGQIIARASVQVQERYNQLLARLYADAGVAVADVAAEFSSTRFDELVSLPNGDKLPLNVARICEWTWMCAPPPVGPNVHPNAAGYQAIARALQRVMAPEL